MRLWGLFWQSTPYRLLWEGGRTEYEIKCVSGEATYWSGMCGNGLLPGWPPRWPPPKPGFNSDMISFLCFWKSLNRWKVKNWNLFVTRVLIYHLLNLLSLLIWREIRLLKKQVTILAKRQRCLRSYCLQVTLACPILEAAFGNVCRAVRASHGRTSASVIEYSLVTDCISMRWKS